MIVKFDQDDVEFVRDWAIQLETYKTANGCAFINFLEYSNEVIECMGKFGEMAAARALNTYPNFDITKEGDNGIDLNAWGLTWQVKTSNIRKLIFNSLDEFVSDAAVLVHLLSSKESMFEVPHFQVLGGISRSRFEKQHYKHDFGYGMRAVCDLDQLTGLNTIKEKCKT